MRSVLLGSFLFLCRLPNANAGVSFLGISAGDDTMTLASILSQSIQQVAILKDIAAFTNDMKQDVSFVKDIYDTGDEVVAGRWAELSDTFVGDILGSDPSLRQIRDNTTDMIDGKVPRGTGFRRIIATGLAQSWFDLFGGYPDGRAGTQYAVSDYQSQNLEKIANELSSSARRAREQERLKTICSNGLSDCQLMEGRMSVVQAQTLQHLLDVQNAQATATATQMGIATDEKKAAAVQQQKEQADIVKALGTLSGTEKKPSTWTSEDFAR